MDFDRFTDKAKDAVREAIKTARRNNNSQIEIVHLLDALLRQEEGVVPQIIAKVNGNLAEAQRVAEEEIERLPQVLHGFGPGHSIVQQQLPQFGVGFGKVRLAARGVAEGPNRSRSILQPGQAAA